MKAATNSSKHILLTFGFQSTPPVKAATVKTVPSPSIQSISIHAAREGGDKKGVLSLGETIISIHAAREGGDAVNYRNKNLSNISIHAAREGGD